MGVLEEFPMYRQKGCGDSQVPFLEFVLVFTLVVYFFETYLDLRQLRRLKAKAPPEELLSAMKKVDAQNTAASPAGGSFLDKTVAKFTKSQEYGVDKATFGLFEGVVEQITSLLIYLGGGMPWMWDASVTLAGRVGLDQANEMSVSLLFLALVTLWQTVLGLPFGLYRTFVIEQKHGFNKQTLRLYLADKVKGLVLTFVLGGPCIYALLYLLEWGGEYFYLYVWGFLFILSLVMMTVYPVLIAPLFNKYTALEEGDLRTRIESLAAKVKFPLTKLFVVDGSKRSAHSNAYMYGFGKNKRIVLFDTLIEQVEPLEIEAILGHELGHWKMKHTVQGFMITQVYVLVMFASFGMARHLEADILRSFGFSDQSRLIGLTLFFTVLWAPVEQVLGFLMNMLSRRNEFQADKYATDLGYASPLQLGLVKLQLENMGNMNPDPLYSSYHYSHPPLVERLRAISDLAAAGRAKKD